MFLVGLAIFTLGSAAAALAPSIEALIAARALQGVGGAIVTPLTLTILSGAVPPARRGLALGIWGGVSGLAVALGPVVGGAVVEGLSWQWIFWLNVPIGVVLLPSPGAGSPSPRARTASLDLPGLGLASAGLLGIVWGLVRGNEHGWTSLGVAGPIARRHRPARRLRLVGAAHRGADGAACASSASAPSRRPTPPRC